MNRRMFLGRVAAGDGGDSENEDYSRARVSAAQP
jgi:hypothetical protein